MTAHVKIQIEENEWAETPFGARKKILHLMNEYGYDTKALEALERELSGDVSDIYRQFYGDEES